MGLLLSLMLTSCGLYNKYERPEDLNTKGLIRDLQSDGDTLAVNTDENFGNLPWREVFTDPQLQGLIETALENNVDLRNAALNVKMMETALTCAKLAFLPSVAFAPQGTISQVQMDGASVNRTYQLPVAATWNIDLFGNLLSQKRSAQMKLLATKDYQVAVQTKIICGVANLYYTLMMLDEQLAIVTDMEGLTKDTWDMMQLQMQLGRARSTSVQTAEANYYSVQAKKADLKRQIREMENSMSLLLNEAGHQIARGKFYNQSLPTSFSTGVGIQLLSNRPDVHAAEMSLAQCFYDTETARSRFYPSLKVTGTAMVAPLCCRFTHTAHLPARTDCGWPEGGQGSAGAGAQHLPEHDSQGWQRGEQCPSGLQHLRREEQARREAGENLRAECGGYQTALHL